MVELPGRGRLAWWVAGLVLAAVVVGTIVAFVGTFVTALFLYYVCRPVYRRLRPRLGRSLAAVGALVSLAIPIVVLVWYTLLIGVQELLELAEAVDLGPAQAAVEPYVDVSAIVQDPASLLQDPDVTDATLLVAEGVLEYLPLVVLALLHLFLALAATFYMLRDGPRLARWVRATFSDDGSTSGTGVEEAVLVRYGRIVDEDLSSVYFGNILNAAITAVIGAITYNLLNVFAPAEVAVPYPALLGLLAGAASLVPVVGMKLVYVPVGALLLARALFEGDPLWFAVAFFAASLVVVDTIPDLVLRPYVSGRNLHVGLVMIAYIVGPLLFGWYGLFLGPLLLVLVVHFGRIVVPEILGSAPRPTGPTDAKGTEGTQGRRVGVAPSGALVGSPSASAVGRSDAEGDGRDDSGAGN